MKDEKVIDIATKKPKRGGDPEKLINKILASIDHWVLERDANGAAYVTVPIGNHFETVPTNSPEAVRILRLHCFLELAKLIPSREVLNSVIATLETKAMFFGKLIEPKIRVATTDDGILFDLFTGFVKCTPRGVSIEADAGDIRFLRKIGMMPQVPPSLNTSHTEHLKALRDFRSLFNLDPANWALLQLFLVACLRDGFSFPVLAVNAEHGAGKTSLARAIKLLIDPTELDDAVNAASDDFRDIFVMAEHAWLSVFDNLSSLSARSSDALATIATGVAYRSRELHTNSQISIRRMKRPIVLTSIGSIVSRHDLGSRIIQLNLPAIPSNRRLAEDELWRRFQILRPAVLGALFFAVSRGLQNISSTQVTNLPRLADFAKWASACESALDMEPGEALALYSRNLQDAQTDRLSTDPILEHIQALVLPFEMAPSALLALFHEKSTPDARRNLPGNAQQLSVALKRLAPALRENLGIAVEFNRGRSRTIRFSQIPQPS